ncbi:dicarboxylate/amino acid:cation symporter [Luteimonas sp. RIT-PG2_3]
MSSTPAPRRFRLTGPVRVLLSLLVGAVAGLSLAIHDQAFALQVADVVQPIGRLWLNALQMTVVPLVTALVIVGINTASDAAASGRTARTAIAVFIVLLIASATFSAFAAPALLGLVPRDDSTIAAFRAALQAPEVLPVPPSAGQWISALIPSNVVATAAASAMLPLVVFAMFFGFALSRLETERRERILDLVRSIGDTMIVIVRWVLWAAPIGVFALVLAVCARVGLSILGALGYYILLLCTIYISITVMLYGVAVFAAGERLKRFASALIPVQAIAASTQSSLASLPVMIDSARTRLGYPVAVTSLVLPMAVSLFRITSPAQYIAVATFIAWLYGIEPTTTQYAAAIFLAAAISMGAVGLPGQVSFMTSNMPITQTMGLPVEPLGVLLAVDTIPDVFCTIGNTTGDMTATSILAKRAARDAAAAGGDA